MMMKSKTQAQQGFTLIELMIAVTVISIIAAIAYPSYSEYVSRGNRSEGQALLSDAAAAQERYYAQNFVYITTAANLSKLFNTPTPTSRTGRYTLSVGTTANDGGYTLTATPTFDDSACGALTLNALGERDRTGSEKTREECWR
ncbi:MULTISPECIES: type IV pilin protein [unclassified Pseudomonas]|uniref:type IV pilin protein n=2 Tax=Pseudomonas TaxID=286 RepID=UPI00244ABDEE|nr:MULTISPECIES: type IV pilin protein [unclassified Pseudomonas]